LEFFGLLNWFWVVLEEFINCVLGENSLKTSPLNFSGTTKQLMCRFLFFIKKNVFSLKIDVNNK
jgi:hypothetical protein